MEREKEREKERERERETNILGKENHIFYIFKSYIYIYI